MSIKQLDLNPRYLLVLLQARIQNVDKLLSFSNLELQKRTGLDKIIISEILKAASCYVLNTSVCTAFHLFNNDREDFKVSKISTGCTELDKILNGGILYPGITEITGESASGKTQLCLQLCLMSQLSRKSVVEDSVYCLYVCTEDVFPTKRLLQMTQHFCKANKDVFSGKSSDQVTNDIFIEHVSDIDDLQPLLELRIPALLKKRTIKLIVIDSITALFRVEFDSSNLVSRARMLSRVGSFLHRLSYKHHCCIICVNQVSTVIDTKPNGASKSLSCCNKLIPSLGLTWSYMITTRLILSRTHYTHNMFTSAAYSYKGYDPIVRCCQVCFAPHLPNEKAHFLVTADGLKGFSFPNS